MSTQPSIEPCAGRSAPANLAADGRSRRLGDGDVRLHRARQVVLRRGELAELDPVGQRLVDEHWGRTGAVRSGMFDGPLVAAVDVVVPSPTRSSDGGADGYEGTGRLDQATEPVEVRWAVTSYRHYLARYAASSPLFARALYVSVLVRTDDGRCAVGQMAYDTSTPGRLQLPGGNVDPPPPGIDLNEQDLLAAARRELLEETGLDVPAEGLRLWAVKTGGSHDDVGIIYTTSDTVPVDHLMASFTAHLRAEATAGQAPELTHLHLMHGPGDLAQLGAAHVDYLEAVLHRHEQETT